MTNLRNVMFCGVLGASAALGCGAEMAPGASATPEMIQGSVDTNQDARPVEVNVEASIQRLQAASGRAPSSDQVLFALAQAYEQNHDWQNMASAMSRAVRVAPHVAIYWQKHGYALLMQAHAGGAQPGTLARAEDAFRTCIAIDPSMGECVLLLTFTTPPRPACPTCESSSTER